MFLVTKRDLRRWLAVLVLPLLASIAAADRAHDFLNAQDFQSAPPQLQGLVESWVDWVGWGEYERDGGQPFAAPTPPGLPADVTHVYIDIDGGGYVKPNGCLYVWSDTFVWIEFSDGSSFVWWHTQTSLTCPDGSVEVFDDVVSSAGVEDPTDGSWSGWIRSYSRENLDVRRRASIRGSAGASVQSSSFAGLPRPIVGPDTDDVDVTIAPGGVLDLRGLDGAAGPIFETSGPVVIRCDQVLMDPGVVIADLFAPPPILAPGEVVHEVALVGRRAEFLGAGPGMIAVRAQNLGNVSEPTQLDWIDVFAWSWGGPQIHTSTPGACSNFQIPVQVPPMIPAATESPLQLQLSFAGQVAQYDGMLVSAQPAPPPPQTYCTAKPNSAGCVPQISTSGAPTLSGYDDFVIRASNVLADKNGLVFYGFNTASSPFQGGYKCVQSPVFRTPIRTSTGGNPGVPCDGVYAFGMTQQLMSLRGISAGQFVCAQWWTRDPQASFGIGLTDATSFVVGP